MKFKNIVLGIGIFVVYFLVLLYGIQTFYPQPQYEDYCDYSGRTYYHDQSACTYPAELSEKERACYSAGGNFVYEYADNGCIIGGYCDECGISYNEDIDRYNERVFWISLITGLITIVIGYSVLSIEPVGSSLMGSGVLAIIYGSLRNWQNFTSALKFGLLLAILVILILLAIRINQRKSFFGKIFTFKRKKRK